MASRIDLKYRPRRFADVLGNEGVVQLLLKRSQAGTLTDQSMMFGGPKGVGKTTLARIVVMAVVCQSKEGGEPCGCCPACLAVLNETSMCVEELDAASQGTVDRIREMIHDSEYEVPGGVGNIYIVDEAQRLSIASQDAMLKAIEDRSIVVIMCTTESHKIRESIRSRVEEYPVSAPSADAMVAKLIEICKAEGIEHDADALKILSKSSQNCPRVCIRAVETIAVSGPVDLSAARSFLRFSSHEAVDKVLAMIDDNPKAAVAAFDALADQEGASWVRDAMVLAVASGLRADAGVSHAHPCQITFFQTRLRSWSEFARQIGMMERPTAAGILSALLATRPGFVSTVQVRALAPLVSTPAPVAPPGPPAAKADFPAANPLEIGGVMFSSSERLTTLDAKVGATQEPAKELEQSVEFRSDMIPMSDREFARDFISKIRRR